MMKTVDVVSEGMTSIVDVFYVMCWCILFWIHLLLLWKTITLIACIHKTD